MLTTTGPPQTCLGNHNTQGSGTYTGKEFNAGLKFVACSHVRRLSDITFDPPFPVSLTVPFKCTHDLKLTV